jgi:putative aldouronate transport system permease protein
MVQPELFRLVVVVTDTIKSAGFATIIYLAALSNVSEEIVESAIIDGANRRHLMFFINIPSILPTIAVLFVLRVANMFSSNFEQIWSLYNPAVYETGDVIATYIYRVGLGGGKFEAGTAMGLIFSVIGLVLLLLASRFIRRMNVMGIF